MEKEKKHPISSKKRYQYDTFNFHIVNPKKIYHRKEKYISNWAEDYPSLEEDANTTKRM
jgi:hypothetical protein